jgi:hypothetical protein
MRLCAWVYAFIACLTAADLFHESTSGERLFPNLVANAVTDGERITSLVWVAVGAILLFVFSGGRSVTVLQILIFTTALAIALAFPETPISFFLMAFTLGLLLWRPVTSELKNG